jgi:hypothetical protein
VTLEEAIKTVSASEKALCIKVRNDFIKSIDECGSLGLLL